MTGVCWLCHQPISVEEVLTEELVEGNGTAAHRICYEDAFAKYVTSARETEEGKTGEDGGDFEH